MLTPQFLNLTEACDHGLPQSFHGNVITTFSFPVPVMLFDAIWSEFLISSTISKQTLHTPPDLPNFFPSFPLGSSDQILGLYMLKRGCGCHFPCPFQLIYTWIIFYFNCEYSLCMSPWFPLQHLLPVQPLAFSSVVNTIHAGLPTYLSLQVNWHQVVSSLHHPHK